MRYLFFILFILCSCSKNTQINPEDQEENTSRQVDAIPIEYVEIYLLDNLNEDRGYCIDVKGSKVNANPENGLQVHTCYSYRGEISVDQGFDENKTEEDEFYMPYFDLCMQAENIIESSNIELKNCNKNEKQKFSFNDQGEIVALNNSNLCLTVSKNTRDGGGGDPIHKIRDLSLEICSEEISSRQKWGLRKTK